MTYEWEWVAQAAAAGGMPCDERAQSRGSGARKGRAQAASAPPRLIRHAMGASGGPARPSATPPKRSPRLLSAAACAGCSASACSYSARAAALSPAASATAPATWAVSALWGSRSSA